MDFILKRLFLFFLLILGCQHVIFASDIVVNVVPNPVASGDAVRISITSEQALQSVELEVGRKKYALTKISDKIYRVNLRAFDALFNGNPSLKVVTKQKSKLNIPISVSQKRVAKSSDDDFALNFDAKETKSVALDNRQQEIDVLQDKIDLSEREKRDLKAKIDALEELLAKQKQSEADAQLVKEQKLELERLRNNLKSQEAENEKLMKDLMSQMKLYNEKQKEMNRRESILNELQSNINVRAGEIEEQEESLKVKSKQLTKEEKEIKSKKSQLSKKEVTLASLKQDLEKKNIELDFRKKQITKKEDVIQSESKKILKEKSALEGEKKELDTLNQKISEKEESLSQLSKELRDKQEQLVQEEQKIYKNSREKEKRVKAQQAYVFKLQSQLNKNIESINKLEEMQKLKAEEFQGKVVEYQEKLDEVQVLQASLDKEKELQDDIELEIKIKYELLNKLSKIIQAQIAQMKNEYKSIKASQDQYLSDLDQRVHYLTTLSYLMEKQSKEIAARNESLQKKNFKLKYRLEKDSYHAYSANPFLGVKVNNDTSYDNQEYGIRWSSYFGTRYMASAGLAFTNYVYTSDSNNSNVRNQTFALMDVGYLLTHTKKTDLYATLGIDADFFSTDRTNYVTYGMNYRYFMKKDLVSRLGLRVADLVTVELGFEKYFGPLRRQKLMGDVIDTSVDDFSSVDVILDEVESFYQFKPKGLALPDLNKHWSKNAASRIAELGIIEPVYEQGRYIFKPSQAVTYMEAAKLLLNTYYANELMNTDTLKLDFSIVGVTDQPVKVSFAVLDEDKALIKTLTEDKDYFPGQYSVSWDGSFDYDFNNTKEFILGVTTKKQSLVKDKKSFKLDESFISSAEKAFKVHRIHGLHEHPNYAFLADKDIKYRAIKRKIGVDFFDKSISGIEGKAITRLDFMLATSKLLQKMGAKTKNVDIDFSYYNDADQLTAKQKELLKTYVIELGYGGSEKRMLNPDRQITRAEVATIIHRILFWENEELIKNVFGE